jgi:uncharacterized protein
MAGLVILDGHGVPPRGTIPHCGTPPSLHLLDGDRPLAFVVEGSLLFGLEPTAFASIHDNPTAQQELVNSLRIRNRDSSPIPSVPLPSPNSISLNIAQSCNLSCSYCYADEGRFGGRASMMSLETAFASIDRLFAEAAGQRVTLGFIGGEPFLNREVLYASVEHAIVRSRETGSPVGFSVTTNGTLLTTSDLDLFRRHSFAVSVSLDGGADTNDRHRKSFNGKSGFQAAIRSLQPLLEIPGKARVAARCTITREDLRVLDRIDALADAGFSEIGVSPLRTSAEPGLAFRDDDWLIFLDEMVRAAESERERFRSGLPLRFSNLAIALKQLHAGYSKPLPCGSAASYVSVSARGEYFTCHRTIDSPGFNLGNAASGLSQEKREQFLRSRHVDRQEPCRSCWARYLCGGGCHAEVLAAGRSGCDYIRGWLEYCLRFYDQALREFPSLFGEGETAS